MQSSIGIEWVANTIKSRSAELLLSWGRSLMEGVGHPTRHPRCIKHVATYSVRKVGCYMPRDHLTSSCAARPTSLHRCIVSIIIKTYKSIHAGHRHIFPIMIFIDAFKSCFIESPTLHHKHVTVTRGATVHGKANFRLLCRYTWRSLG